MTNGAEGYTVYLHRNKASGKVYIGLTGKDPEKRWRKGNGYRGVPGFYADIRKDGWDSFDHEIIASNLTMEQAARMEKDLIAEYRSTNPNKGYNAKPGGTCGFQKSHSKETRKLLSQKCRGWTHTEEAKRKISEAGKGHVVSQETRRKISEAQIGRIITEEQRKHMSEARKGKPLPRRWALTEEGRKNLSEAHKNSELAKKASAQNLAKAHAMGAWNNKKVLCVETGETWASATAAAKTMGCCQTSLSEACRFPHKTCKGYHWKYLDAGVS